MNNLKKIAVVILISIGFGMFGASCNSGAGNVASNEPIELKLNFKPGDKYLYSTQLDQKIESVMSMDQTMAMDMIFSYAGDSAGSKKLSITYDHVSVNMNSPMGQMNYDSKKPGNSDGMSGMGDIIGKTFSVWVTSDGSIQSIEGLSELLNSPSKSGKPEMTSPLNDTVIKTMMQGAFNIYPTNKVKIGDTWIKKTQVNANSVNLNVENTYTLKSVEGGKAILGLSATMNLPKSNMGPEGAGVQMEMNGTQEGTLDIDIATGQMLSGKIKQDIKGTITMESMGQPIPLNIKGTITTTSKKL
jgi:hypothetical protein